MMTPQSHQMVLLAFSEVDLNFETLKLTYGLTRPSYGVPGHRPPPAYRDEPYTQALPHAHFRAQHRCRKVTILVFLDEITES